jgi:hypothetical protein
MQQSAVPSLAMPQALVGLAIDRIDLLGLHPIDRRDAIAVLSLIAAGMDPAKITSKLSETLRLDVAAWPRVIAGLEAAGIISTPGRDGRRGILR